MTRVVFLAVLLGGCGRAPELSDGAPPGDDLPDTPVAGDSGDPVDPVEPPGALDVLIQPAAPTTSDVLTCTASDPAATLTWTESDGWARGTGATLTLTPADTRPGTVLVCTATSGARTGEGRVTVNNRPPVLDGPALPARVEVGDAVECAATAEDPDGAEVELAVVWDDGSDAVARVVPPWPGETPFGCEVTAVDADGGQRSARASAVVAAAPPQVRDLRVLPAVARPGDTVRCEATVDDPNGDAVTVTVTWSDGVTGPTRPVTDVTPRGPLTCTLAAADPGGLSAQGTAAATVRGPLPAPGAVRNDPWLGEVVWIPPGTFERGCVPGRDDSWNGCYPSEVPTQRVTLTHGFWMMRKEVTQAQYVARLGVNPSSHRTGGPFPDCGADCPVETVRWQDAMSFATVVSALSGVTPCSTSGDPYACRAWRLPTEAEWERAARADEAFEWAGGDDPQAVGWTALDGRTQPSPGCARAPNAWGLCDLSGNVWEWIYDFYQPWVGSAATNPWGSVVTLQKHVRGGAYDYSPQGARLANRNGWEPGNAEPWLGFRLVRIEEIP
jgi:formylglycine-generating enzyme required for sulfatase activity